MTRHELRYQVPAPENRRIMLRQFAFSPKLLACMALAVAVSAWVFFTGDQSFAVLFILAALGGYGGLTVAVLRNANQSWRAEPKTLTFDSEQVSASGPGGSSSLPWGAFCRFWLDSRYFYLRLSRGGTIWLPRAAFSQEQSASFIEYANRSSAEQNH
jgi:hypothetical protein